MCSTATLTSAFLRCLRALLLCVALLLVVWPSLAQRQAPIVYPTGKGTTVRGNEGLVADSTELRVLRQFYYATNGDNWANNANWLQHTTLDSVATWYGVSVAGGDVTALALNNNNLQGTLPACLSELSALQTILLASNQLQDGLPGEWSQLGQLQVLSLSFNQLVGKLPRSWGQLAQLQSLYLDSNQLTGILPVEWGQLSQLQVLQLGQNDLSGTLPPEWGQLRSLQSILLTDNELIGTLPVEWGQLASLQQAYFTTNQLSGTLPAEWGQLAQLQGLYLDSNQLTGSLPGSWSHLTQVQTIQLRNNSLTGTLPATWSQLAQLTTLDLSTNQLTGSLPPSWSSLAHLSSLRLTNNNLGGTFPASWAQLTSLESLNLAGNHIGGTLPAALVQQPALRSLNLRDNNLIDVEPLTQASFLTLDVRGNYLGFGALEGLYRSARRPWLGYVQPQQQRMPPRVDTLQFVATSQLVLRVSGRAAAQAYRYQWQRWVGGQWVAMPGDTLATKTWTRATAAEQGTYRRVEHNRWFTSASLAPTELYSARIYADMVPYTPLDQNRPDDTNQGLAIKNFMASDSADWHSAGQTDMNYVRVWTPRVALTDARQVPTARVDSVSMSTQYLDGLGRPVQTVLKQASPAKRDMVQPQAYDGLGREPVAYLPYADQKNGDGGYRPQALRQQHDFYYPSSLTGPPVPDDPTLGVARTGRAYAQTVFETSPLNRVTAQGAAGEAWQVSAGHVVERQERPNTAADSVLWFVPGYDPKNLDPGCRGFYAPGELWGTDVSDAHGPAALGAHGYRTIEWKNKLGQVVCKQVEAARTGTTATGLNSRWLRTGYVYDDFGRLRFVVQPEGTKRLLAAGGGAPPLVTGTITREQWDSVPGTSVSAIPLTQLPTSTGTLSALEGPTNVAEDYGDRIRGYVQAPQTGDYSFWLAGDDMAELWLSPDQDPAHKQREAWTPGFTPARQWLWYPEQRSRLIHLEQGQFYYLEVLHKEGSYNDNLSVTWQLPDGTGYGQPIAGQYLAPYAGNRPRPVPDLNAFLFHYRYDGRGRQIAKQVPGQDGETLVVYDQLDRPILSQDAQQRTQKQWGVTKYDALGRVVLTGLLTQADTVGQVRLQALASADTAASHQYEQRVSASASNIGGYSYDHSFPRLGQDGFVGGQALSLTYYDDYDFDNNGQADARYDTSQDGQFPSSQAPVADAVRTQGLVTRTQTRVLGVADNDPVQAAWLTTTTFYDGRARPVQVQATNARKGTDLLTTQLDFTGKVVQSVASHQGPSLTTPLLVKEFFTYDHTGRLLTTRQQLPGEARPARLDSVQYNEVGQVVRKTLGTGRLKQEVDYAYNIRGWLTSLNDPYQPNPTKNDLFSLSLHYERGFTAGYEQYNGNLTGQTWRGRDGVQRAYGYVYDPLNRLLQGDFVARQTTTAATPSAGAWTAEQDNYRLSFVSYDDNGNILTLRRRGLLQNATHTQGKQYGAVDNLSYAYQGNRLTAVDDAVTGNQLPRPANYNGAPTSLAGDFQEQGVKLGQEYLYDANGNLTQDKNKGITGIVYNHLNLPRQIHFGQVGDSVVFRYAASGQKVAKLVYQTGKATPLRTDYLGPYQYEQDSLKFFPHAEGRVLRFVSSDAVGQAKVSYQREFTLKDHLGNLRLAYRAGQTRTYLATLEQDANTRKRETQQFDSLSVSPPIAVATPYAMGQYAARLNAGGSTPQPLGPLTQLTVQKGDSLRISAPGLYPQKVNNSSFFFSLASFVAGLLQPAPAGAPPRADGSRRGGLPLLQVGLNAASLTAVSQLSNGVPKGYLRVLVFNQDSVLVDQRKLQLTQDALGHYQVLSDTLSIRRDGYVTVYVGNESPVDVYFDELRIEHHQGLQIQETQYDPWGLDLAGVSGAAPGLRLKNYYQFNSKERQTDLGLCWSDYGARFYANDAPRWLTIDPLAHRHFMLSPYTYAGNNPVNAIDPDGRDYILTVLRNKAGEITGIDISSTIYIAGAGASQKRANELNKFAGDNLKHRKIDGVMVSLGITYQYNEEKNDDNLKAGENLLHFDAASEGGSAKGGRHNISAVNGKSNTETGNTGTIYDSGKDNSTIMHESMHFMGLSDRYDEREQLVPGYVNKYTRSSEPHPGFRNNRMGDHTKPGLDNYQYLRYKLYGESMPNLQQAISSYPSTNLVDKNANGDLGTPYEKGGVHHDENLTVPIH
jgi:RHS repeat-associated protein